MPAVVCFSVVVLVVISVTGPTYFSVVVPCRIKQKFITITSWHAGLFRLLLIEIVKLNNLTHLPGSP